MENLIPSIFSSYDNAVSSSELENSTSKLDDIIKRLNSSNIPPITRIKTEPVDSDEENLVCRAADASTQTSLNFIKAVIRAFILDRMKSLDQDFFVNAAQGRDLLVKIQELEKENKELERTVKLLQEKTATLMKQREIQSNSTKEISSSVKSISENIPMDTLEKQSAVISPYNVTVSSTVPNVSHSTVQGSFRQMPSIDPGVPGPSGMRQQFIQVNTPNMSANNQQLCSTSRTGPQVKYVPLRLTAQQPSRYNQLPYSNLTQSQLPTGYVQGQPVALNRPSLPSDHGMHSGQTASAAPRMSAVGSYQQPIHFLPRSSGTHQPHPTQIIRQPGNSNQTYHSIARPAQAGNLLHNVPTQIAQGQRPVVVQGNRPSPPVNQTLAIAGTRGAPVRLNQTPLRDLSHISVHGNSLPLPGRPHVNINVTESGIVLSWDNDPTEAISPTIAEYYHLFASQDNPGPATPTIAWKKIGVVKALPLPMACTLTQFASGNSYHFAIRAVDIYGREGPLSNPCTVTLR